MTRALMAFLIVASLGVQPALPWEMSISGPEQAAKLSVGGLDMIAYHSLDDENRMHVQATFIDRSRIGAPIVIEMLLAESDTTSFSIPGYPDVIYTFQRLEDRLVSRADTAVPRQAGG